MTPNIVEWIVGVAGGGEARVTPISHHRPMWSVDVIGPDQTVQLFVRSRRDSGSVLAPVYTLEREATVLRSLAALGIPAPKMVGFHPGAQLLVLERLPGRSDFHSVKDLELRSRVLDRFVDVLVDLHSRAPAAFSLEPVMAIPRTPAEHALGELQLAERLYDAVELTPEPVMTLGRDWMRRHVPPGVDHTCFIQGDTGPGNFMFDDSGNVWLVDMEISHFGDPMEDLAAICVRDMVTPVGDLRPLFARYDALTRWQLDLDRVRYHRVSKCVRSLMAIVSLAERGAQPDDDLAWWAYRALYVRGACQALAEAMGLELGEVHDPEVARAGAPTPPPAHSHGSSRTRPDARASPENDAGDSALTDRGTECAGVALAVLERADAYGADFAQADRAGLDGLLGSGVTSVAQGLGRLDLALREGSLGRDHMDVLRFLSARAERQCVLLRPAMRSMADGRFSAIE